MTTIFGMNESVCSWIDVAACTIETISPTASPATRKGADTVSASVIAWTARWTTVPWVTAAPSPEALDERLHYQVPPVHEHEEQDLERQRDQDRGQHHHPHGHERRRDDHVDDEEREVDQEADLERRRQLGDDERGHEHVGRDVGARARPLPVREPDEQRQVGVARLLEHERADRLEPAHDRLARVDLVPLVGLDGDVVDRADGRRHHEHREEERDPDEHLVRRARLRPERVPDEPEHDQDPREARHHDEHAREQRGRAEEQHHLDRARDGLGLREREDHRAVILRSASTKAAAVPRPRSGPSARPAPAWARIVRTSIPSPRASSGPYTRIGVTLCSLAPTSTSSSPTCTRWSERDGASGADETTSMNPSSGTPGSAAGRPAVRLSSL